MSGASPLLRDAHAIPADETQRILRVPIPLDARGKSVATRDSLVPAYRRQLLERHERKILENLRRRDKLIQDCAKDSTYRAEATELCKKDIVFWINHFVWTTDPRDPKGGTSIPFVLYAAQEREARFYQDVFLKSKSMTWMDEKSRAWGWTWLHCAACTTHSFLFLPTYSCLIGAANQDDIDDGGLAATAESMFGKIRFILNRLPSWMLPPGLIDNDKLNKMHSIRHPSNENVVKGRQYCSKWGRGQRYTETKSDEATWSLEFEAAAYSFSQTSRRNHVGSTPRGLDNEYARMRFDESTEKEIHTLHWTDNPNLDVDWYWGERAKWGVEKCAQELDIDYKRSSSRVILPTFDRQHAMARLEIPGVPTRDVAYDDNLPLVVAADPGWDDPFAILWIQPHRGLKEFRILDFVQYTGRSAEFFAPFLLGYIPERTLENRPWPFEYDELERFLIERHMGWAQPAEGCGDAYGASASAKQVTGRTVYDLWSEYGCVDVYPWKITNKEEAIEMLRAALPRIFVAPWLEDQRTQGRDQPTILECFEHYAWVARESPTGREQKRAPRHDKYCHAMDALQQFLQWEDCVDPSVKPIPPDYAEKGDGRGRRRTSGEPEEPFVRLASGVDPISEG